MERTTEQWFEAGRQHAYQDTFGDNPADFNPIENHPTEAEAAESTDNGALAAWRAGYEYGEKEMQR